MLATESSSASGYHQLIQGPKSSRRPLQPMNQSSLITTSNLKPNPHQQCRHPMDNSSNKENLPPVYSVAQSKKEPFPIEPFDASLADELSAIREKMERLRIDRDKNDELLREKGFVMDLQFKEILNRGEIQKQLEIEVDRLYRLKEIRLACTRISQIRSLRDKELEKKMKQDTLNKAHTKNTGMDEQKDQQSSQK